MEKVLVTGGAGFVGAHLVKNLIEKNYKVMIVDSLNTIGGIPFIHPKSIFIKGDILDPKVLKKIKSWRPKIIYHLAAQSGGESAYDNPKFDYLTNGYGTYLLAKLALEINISHFIYTSSVAVYGSNKKKKISEKSEINPDSIYGISKFVGEMFVKQILYKSKVKTTIFRLFNSFGPGENLNYLKKGMVSIYSSYVWRNKPIIVKGSLNRIRNYQYIDDVSNILILTLKNKKLKKNELLNLTTGKAIKVKNLIAKILKHEGKKKLRIIVKRGTPGDSFGFDANNKILKKKFNNYRFISLEQGIKKYFKWINSVPRKKNIKNFHPFQKNKLIK